MEELASAIFCLFAGLVVLVALAGFVALVVGLFGRRTPEAHELVHLGPWLGSGGRLSPC